MKMRRYTEEAEQKNRSMTGNEKNIQNHEQMNE